MAFFLDHVALLVEDADAALARAQALFAGAALEAGPVESFPGEGTREVYLGADDRSARLLLMQPLGAEGPYARALRKRGPGLHHVAVVVPELASACVGFSGWLMHPRSLTTAAACKTAWLARPGVPTLLEVTEGEPPQTATRPVVESLEISCAAELGGVFEGLHGVERSPAGLWLTVGGCRVAADELCGRG